MKIIGDAGYGKYLAEVTRGELETISGYRGFDAEQRIRVGAEIPITEIVRHITKLRGLQKAAEAAAIDFEALAQLLRRALPDVKKCTGPEDDKPTVV